MEISLNQILNEIVEEVTENNKFSLMEGEDPSIPSKEEKKITTPEDKEQLPKESSAMTSEDEALMVKLSQVFTPEEISALTDKLESGEISEDDIVNYLSSQETSQPVSESYVPTMPIALAVGVGALMYRNK